MSQKTQELIKLEEEKFLKYYKKLTKEFEEGVCLHCVGTKKQKKRECGILGGFTNLGCNYREEIITSKLKPYNQTLIKMRLHK